MAKNKKRKIKIRAVLGLFIIIIFVVLGFCILNIYNTLKSSKQAEVEILDSIETYDYKLDENDSDYFTSLFKELKSELSKKDVDEEKYATLMSQLFVTDFYSLDASLNKNDVGGKQFVYTDYQDDFVSYAKDSIYKYVENNIYGKRDQELPLVKSVEVTDIKQDTYESESDVTDDNAYYVTLEITYAEDLDYPTECSLTIIHSNDKLEIAEME